MQLCARPRLGSTVLATAAARRLVCVSVCLRGWLAGCSRWLTWRVCSVSGWQLLSRLRLRLRCNMCVFACDMIFVYVRRQFLRSDFLAAAAVAVLLLHLCDIVAAAARAVFQLVGAPASPTLGNMLIPAGWLPFVGAYSYAVRRLSV